jgi:hypothetical protein
LREELARAKQKIAFENSMRSSSPAKTFSSSSNFRAFEVDVPELTLKAESKQQSAVEVYEVAEDKVFVHQDKKGQVDELVEDVVLVHRDKQGNVDEVMELVEVKSYPTDMQPLRVRKSPQAAPTQAIPNAGIRKQGEPVASPQYPSTSGFAKETEPQPEPTPLPVARP